MAETQFVAETQFAKVQDYCLYRWMRSVREPTQASSTSYAYADGYNTISKVVYRGIQFSDIADPSNVEIVGYKIRLKGGQGAGYSTRNDYTYLGYRLITDFSTAHGDSTTIYFTGIDGFTEPKLLFGVKDRSETVDETDAWWEYEVQDENDDAVKWMNSNKSTLFGGTQFGIYLEGRYFRVYSVGLVLYYIASNSIYVGDQSINSIYVGDNKASAVYIGTTKVL